MNASYVTLYNGLTLLIKPVEKINQLCHCYYWFNNSWVPTTLDIRSIADMRFVQLNETNMLPYNDSIDEFFKTTTTNKFTRLQGTYRTSSIGGKELFTNDENGTNSMPHQSVGLKNKFDLGTVISPVFPKVDSNWFYTGFPTKLTVGGTNGDLIKFIPIYFYATKNGSESFTLPKLPDRLGYLNRNNEFDETLVWDGPFKKGELLFTILLDKNDSSCTDSTIYDTSYWDILTEFSNIDPGSGATKSITITSGITKEESFSMGMSIGSNIVVDVGLEGIGKLSAKLSAELTKSFNSFVSITRRVTTTDTVDFKPQEKTQRIATYQFIERYTIDSAKPLKEKIEFFNNKNKNYIANFSVAQFEAKVFDYESRYFAKAFVLDPK